MKLALITFLVFMASSLTVCCAQQIRASHTEPSQDTISLDDRDQPAGEDLHGWFVRHGLMKQVDLLERARHGDAAAEKELEWWCYDHTPAQIRRFLLRPDREMLPDSVVQQRLHGLGLIR